METKEKMLINPIKILVTGDLMPARRKTCLNIASAVKAQAFAPLTSAGGKESSS